MDKTLKKLIQLNLIRDIQLAMLMRKEKGLIINETEINEILSEIEKPLIEKSEEAEIDEDGEDAEKIADAIDTEDLGAKADYVYANEVNK